MRTGNLNTQCTHSWPQIYRDHTVRYIESKIPMVMFVTRIF